MPYVHARYFHASQSHHHVPGLESIALEETALSHILNAEGEKLQRVIGMDDVNFCQLMEVNESVANMVNVVATMEQALKDKLEFISNNLYYPARVE